METGGNTTYYYVVTAVDSNNVESAYSNVTSIFVPLSAKCRKVIRNTAVPQIERRKGNSSQVPNNIKANLNADPFDRLESTTRPAQGSPQTREQNR